MRTKTLHHLLIDSRDRDREAYPHPNAYRLTLPKTYKNVVSVRLLNLYIPTSFYVFSAALGNTTLDISVGTSGFQTITINDGNYRPDSLVKEVRAMVLQTFPDNTFDVWYDPATLKFHITCLEDLDVVVDVPMTAEGGPDDRSLAFLLGFRGTETSQGGTLSASAVINTNPWTYVVLDIDELRTIDECGLNGNPVGKGCFARVMVLDPFSHVFLDGASLSFPAVPQCPAIPKLDRLTVRFRTHEGSLVDFHGADHSFVLEIQTADPEAGACYGLPSTVPSPGPGDEMHTRAQEQFKSWRPPPPSPSPPPPVDASGPGWGAKHVVAVVGAGAVAYAIYRMTRES